MRRIEALDLARPAARCPRARRVAIIASASSTVDRHRLLDQRVAAARRAPARAPRGAPPSGPRSTPPRTRRAARRRVANARQPCRAGDARARARRRGRRRRPARAVGSARRRARASRPTRPRPTRRRAPVPGRAHRSEPARRASRRSARGARPRRTPGTTRADRADRVGDACAASRNRMRYARSSASRVSRANPRRSRPTRVDARRAAAGCPPTLTNGATSCDDARAAADHRVAADAHELVDHRAAADDRPVLDGDVARELHRVRDDDVVAELAVVRDVRVGHEQAVAADPRRRARLGGEVERSTYSRISVWSPTSRYDGSPAYLRSCGGAADHRAVVDAGSRARSCVQPVTSAWLPTRVRSPIRDVRADRPRPASTRHAGAELRAIVDERRGMDRGASSTAAGRRRSRAARPRPRAGRRRTPRPCIFAVAPAELEQRELEAQLVAGRHRPAEARAVDAHEVHQLVVGIVDRVEQQHARRPAPSPR